jgi:predicted AAA+ superfamily ATPase
MFKRRAVDEITAWYGRPRRKPLVVRGARQVGKTTAVRLAAAELGVEIVEINLERHPELDPLFKGFRLQELLLNFSLISGREIARDSKAILFLDEAQATPAAYSCLRYFLEDMPELAVVLTGSLLDQILRDYRLPIPVGRVEHCFMGPLTFEEFLKATGESKAIAAIERLTPETMQMVPRTVHEELMGLVRRYVLTGGMPSSVQTAIDTSFNHAEVVRYQTELLQTYRDDFAKYAGSQDSLRLGAFFNGLVTEIGHRFSHKLANTVASGTSGDYRQLNSAIERFLEARLFYRVVHTSADTIPLGGELRTRISKFLFIDIGLLLAAEGIPPQLVMNSPLELAGRGVLAEQFVGQQLLHSKPGYVSPSLYFWQPPKSEGQAEVDFLFESGNRVIPVEVKSGVRGSMKSLHSYVLQKEATLAVRISAEVPSLEERTASLKEKGQPFRLLNIPFYLVGQLERLTAP